MSNLSDAHTKQPDLNGRRVIVTGGTTGIGRAIAVLLASEGARVFVCGRTPDHLADALTRLREVGDGDGVSVDLSTPEGLDRFFDAADGYLGGLDIAVINAAISADEVHKTEETSLRYAIDVDFTSYLVCTQKSVERMPGGGDIVLIGSVSAERRNPGSSIYVAAKAGVQGFAQSLRQELSEQNIKVGLIEPGLVGADFHYPDLPAEKQRELIEAQQMLRAEDIAVATHFMLTQPQRTAISLIRVEPRRSTPDDK